jgi:hypothetical protein
VGLEEHETLRRHLVGAGDARASLRLHNHTTVPAPAVCPGGGRPQAGAWQGKEEL